MNNCFIKNNSVIYRSHKKLFIKSLILCDTDIELHESIIKNKHIKRVFTNRISNYEFLDKNCKVNCFNFKIYDDEQLAQLNSFDLKNYLVYIIFEYENPNLDLVTNPKLCFMCNPKICPSKLFGKTHRMRIWSNHAGVLTDYLASPECILTHISISVNLDFDIEKLFEVQHTLKKIRLSCEEPEILNELIPYIKNVKKVTIDSIDKNICLVDIDPLLQVESIECIKLFCDIKFTPEIFENNYTLTDIVIVKSKNNYHYKEISEPIIKRNVKLEKSKRFSKSKVAAHD